MPGYSRRYCDCAASWKPANRGSIFGRHKIFLSFQERVKPGLRAHPASSSVDVEDFLP
jgi:hypothetical protein